MKRSQNSADTAGALRRECRQTAHRLGYTGLRERLIALEIFLWRKVHHCQPSEYEKYRFDRLRAFCRKEYLLHYDQYFTYGKVNFPTGMKNKLDQYKRFADLIGREYIPVFPGRLDQVRAFAEAHGKVLFKPVDSSLGKGIFTYDPAADTEEKLFQLLLRCSVKHYICEEFIRQHPQMAAFHPDSVNSLRVLTFNDGKQIRIVSAALKMGLNNAEVDNLTHGGLGANVDVEQGIVNTPGLDHDGRVCYVHPDTDTMIIGTRIPHFDQVCSVACRAAARVPECAVIGWDIAVTEKGACLIEMNNRPGTDTVQYFDRVPRGKEIKYFAGHSKDRVRKLSKQERERYKNYY